MFSLERLTRRITFSLASSTMGLPSISSLLQFIHSFKEKAIMATDPHHGAAGSGISFYPGNHEDDLISAQRWGTYP